MLALASVNYFRHDARWTPVFFSIYCGYTEQVYALLLLLYFDKFNFTAFKWACDTKWSLLSSWWGRGGKYFVSSRLYGTCCYYAFFAVVLDLFWWALNFSHNILRCLWASQLGVLIGRFTFIVFSLFNLRCLALPIWANIRSTHDLRDNHKRLSIRCRHGSLHEICICCCLYLLDTAHAFDTVKFWDRVP